MIREIKNIVLTEDDPRDEELAMRALEEHNLASQVEGNQRTAADRRKGTNPAHR